MNEQRWRRRDRRYDARRARTRQRQAKRGWCDRPARDLAAAARLCEQVREHLHLVLPALDDPILRAANLRDVHEVVPGTLWISVEVESVDLAEITQRRLEAASALLRREVAQAIHRRRTPQLRFVVITPA